MSRLPDYNPNDFEILLSQEDIQEKRYHSQRNPEKTPYTIVMPPPNITGMLHMGHILNNTIQDTLIRFKRMDNFEACWIPGLDHASIATEAKVIQWLASKNIKKSDLSREEFLEYAMQWKAQYGGIINDQLKRLGVSCDWDRERFTMDEGFTKDVLASFVQLYNEGLIYKGTRMVNWCPVSKSAISDEEVEHQEKEGFLWHFSYPIKDSDESIIIATTRPETMFGDVAVMVHPEDSRYKHLIGKTVILPIMNKEIPIIGDTYVDPEFGTGAVKVTPAHDPNDYEVGLRHKLEMPTVMTESAVMSDYVPEPYRGMDRFEAREAVVNEMKELKLLEKIEAHTHKVGYSQRGHVPIESMLSEQWFISMKTLAEKAKEVVENGSIKFYPQHWTKTYFYWLDNIKDWCISRQLWWGHRIPVYSCSCGHTEASTDSLILCPKCGNDIHQDESVLDTWASSWLWSYAVHTNEEDKSYYHPTDTLVTGPDIIFFWVARMIMAAKHFRKEIPFKNVYFTGIIRDDLGRKMSKSLGNSPDPMDIMAEYGADALRYTMVRLAPLGNDILYSSDKVDLGKHFANKIWNAARFTQMNLEQTGLKINELLIDTVDINSLDDFDKSILTRFNNVTAQIRDHFDKFRMNDVTKEMYDFVWGEFCDRYVESSKYALTHSDSHIVKNKLQVVLYMFQNILKMLHPVMPFITEKLWREIFNKKELLFASYPNVQKELSFPETEEKMLRLEKAIYMIREIRAESKVPLGAVPDAIISVQKELFSFFKNNAPVIQKLVKLSALEIIAEERTAQSGEATGSEADFQIFLNLEGIIDKNKEIERLEKEVSRLEKAKSSVEGKLNNPQFTAKAPEQVIVKEKEKLQEIMDELEKTKAALAVYKK